MKPAPLALLAFAATAHAGEPFDEVAPRNLGRAGAPMASADGASALARNPAGLARQPALRVELGSGWIDRSQSFATGDPLLLQPCDPTLSPQTQPTVTDRGSPRRIPSIAASRGLGPIVLGASLRLADDQNGEFPRPAPDECIDDIRRIHPHRYRGITSNMSRSALTLGAAYATRFGLAAGVAVEGSRLHAKEARFLWLGEALPAQVGDPTFDRNVSMEVTGLLASVHGGLFYAPDLPLELAISTSHTRGRTLRGDSGTTRLAIPSTTILRAGARLLLGRFALESTLEYLRRRGAPERTWELTGLTVRSDLDNVTTVTRLPARLRFEDATATRTALDADIVPGLLTVTAGYAFQTNPALHTIAAGVEARFDDLTLIFGYARELPHQQFESTPIDSPFVPMLSSISGRFSRAAHNVGLTLELVFAGPDQPL